ncbi:MAG: NADH-quinone oxidoreductase subunit N [Acidimicrobiales bacterium]|nr:MAG: NADH-quinone oxidoreductase subunit N [Acidimicrobiales bacterium]
MPLTALASSASAVLLDLAEVTFRRPHVDWHALAPELTLLSVGALLTLLDIFYTERVRPLMPALAGLGVLAALVPVLTLATSGDLPREALGSAYVVDEFSLVLKALFLLAGYVVVLLSTNYIAEGDYWENEYYGMLLSSLLGMVVMSSARDLVTVFVALELLSIPAYMLAAWRKRDVLSNEAGLKYYLMGVFASAVMLYGMSLLYGVTGSTLLVDMARHQAIRSSATDPIVTLAIVFVIVGFAFKVSAVPFHTWAPDTYEGAPTPVTAFLSTASKAAGFVALVQLIVVGFHDRADVYQPLMWVLSVASMTVGNLIALRQTNVVRLMAYSGIAQAGFMMAPLAVVGSADAAPGAVSATVTYLLIYAAMNLGAFAVIIAVARRTRSAEIDSYAGLIEWAPGLAVMMSIFLFALAGIPPLGGWFAKFQIFFSVVSAGTWQSYVLGVLIGINSVIALFYYAKIARMMWMEPSPASGTPLRLPPSLNAALGICTVATILFGVLPQVVGRFGDMAGRLALLGV